MSTAKTAPKMKIGSFMACGIKEGVPEDVLVDPAYEGDDGVSPLLKEITSGLEKRSPCDNRPTGRFSA